MGIIASDIRRGMAIMFNGEPCRVLEFHHHTPGNLRAMVQAKLRRLKTGTQVEHRFRSTDTVEIAALETHELDFMYKSGDTYHFMNAENYDQITLQADMVGDQAPYLQPEMKVKMAVYDGLPVSIELPQKVTLEVTETEPSIKSQTAASSYKPATLSNGVRTMVPPFVTTGTRIVVMTADGSYVERAKD